MEKPQYHIFVCASFRVDGEPKGVCNKKATNGLLPYIENEILDRGLDAQVSSTGCLKACDHGPVMVIYPAGLWYGEVVDEAAVDRILDDLEDGAASRQRLIA
jgi:(2Fe-2S) ferredoxin